MARTKREIDPQKLRELIVKLESENQFKNRSELFQAVAQTDWAKESKLTPSVVYLRVVEFDIDIKTPKGKKGNKNLAGGPRIKKPKVAEPKAAAALRKEAAHYGYAALAEKVLSGSMKSAIKLNCILCTSNQKDEVRNCTVFECSFHHLRPYKS